MIHIALFWDWQAFRPWWGQSTRATRCACSQNRQTRRDQRARRYVGRVYGIRVERRAAGPAALTCGPGSVRSTKFNERLWRGVQQISDVVRVARCYSDAGAKLPALERR